MRCIGVAGGISLYAHDDSYISYFNSPFIGHRRSSSIDVYPADGTWDGPAFSPIDGKVTELRTLTMGKKKAFPTSSRDYAIAIAPDGVEDTVVRILHCRPRISVGDIVSKGDFIGSLIRSRYFCFWTGPHYHIEAMRSKDFIRPSQSFPIIVETGRVSAISGDSTNQYECEVMKCTQDIVVCSSREIASVSMNDYHGHLAIIDGSSSILDAGVPHYNQGGLLGDAIPEIGSPIQAFGSTVGRVSVISESFVQFTMEKNVSVSLDGENLGGLSTHLYSNRQLIDGRPPILLVPEKRNQYEGKLSEGDRIVLGIKES
ncbi:MAG: hypothetical protein ACFFEU_12110 [Candidatus Thorarchaeota archaeon]